MVSASLIVRNEERVLARCLDRLRDAVDEIIVVDTGSEDATKRIARRYTDHVLDFSWCDDFSAARQFAFNQASGQWVMWLDADDVVLGAEHIRSLVTNAPPDISVFYWRYVTDRDQHGNSRCEFWRERCVRNDGTFSWVGRIHEILMPNRPCGSAQSTEVLVEHHPEAARATEKLRRNLNLLELEYAASGSSPAPRLLFYLAREYAAAGNVQKALDAFQQYVSVATWDEERYLAQMAVADLHRGLQQYEQALDAGLQALRIHPRWSDAYFGLARTYYFLGDWEKVVHWTDVGRALPQRDAIHFRNPMDHRFNWIIYYTNALYHIGAVAQAREWTEQALMICPDDEWHRQNLLFFTRAQNTGELQEPELAGHVEEMNG
jgi:tetratricopeptide (TPR) repeat protein